MKIRKEHVLFLIAAAVLAGQALNAVSFTDLFSSSSPDYSFHSLREKEVLKQQLGMLKVADDDDDPVLPGEYFLHSVNCRGCHGHDTMQYANVDYNGLDINVVDDWEATMMANSARDPLWRAKVSHEILVNPSHSSELQHKCTSCHAPMGHYTASFHGDPFYTLSDLYADSLGLDGVSCTGCHTIGPNFLGSVFSGTIPYDTNHIIYGPYQNPVQGPMQLYVGYTPTFSSHMSDAKVCSPCHTLLTNSVDLSGNYTGRSFVEQATYHEWVNSVFSADLISCQNCHMPQVTDSVVIANGYLNMAPRSPFNRHKFLGANDFMLKLMQQNRTALNVPATNEHYDSTIAATHRLLTFQTLSLDLVMDSIDSDTAWFTVRLTNRAGHKFPSGYPSRRAVVEFTMVDGLNDTVFQSGVFDPNYEVVGINTGFEPHYQVISDASQAQIYELAAGDVNGTHTTVLERMDSILKDNRIPPEGFVTTSPVYDTVKIVGDAETDPDFNLTPGGVEGTGKDYVHYHIPVSGLTGNFSVYARIFYQPVPPGYLTEMFTFNSAEIDTFRNMYNQADQQPFMVAADSLVLLALEMPSPDWSSMVNVYPVPVEDGWVTIQFPEDRNLELIRVYGADGRLVQTYNPPFHSVSEKIRLPETPGAYTLEIWMDQHRVIKKLVRN